MNVYTEANTVQRKLEQIDDKKRQRAVFVLSVSRAIDFRLGKINRNKYMETREISKHFMKFKSYPMKILAGLVVSKMLFGNRLEREVMKIIRKLD